MNSKSLVLSRIFLVISIIFAVVFLILNFYFQDINNYFSLYRWIALIAIVCNAISSIFKYLAYKIDGIEMKYW